MVKQAMLSRAARDVGSHTVVHDSRGVQERSPRSRPMRRVSRHDVEWKDVEPALYRPARPWDRPMPRPTGRGRRRGRTHGRSQRRNVRSKRTR
jgi:hypothetical protein